MDIFVNIYEFYQRNVFTDLTIFSIDALGSVTKVCQTHRIVFVSLFPKFKEIFQEINEDESYLFIEHQNENELLETIEMLYKCLVTGQDATEFIRNGIFCDYLFKNEHENENIGNLKAVSFYG